ncbi:MAG: hypothetical protein JST00_23120 [Deltaproteobacteria bacterium]|nr:hypothetical protein [Deltaproteobacteria bacterium]
MPRKRFRLVLVSGLLTATGALAFLACDADTTRVGAGAECFLATDCEPGLVCVPQQNGSRICSSDLSRVAGRPPPEAGPRDAGEAGDAEEDATPPEDGGTDAPTDTGTIRDASDAG